MFTCADAAELIQNKVATNKIDFLSILSLQDFFSTTFLVCISIIVYRQKARMTSCDMRLCLRPESL